MKNLTCLGDSGGHFSKAGDLVTEESKSDTWCTKCIAWCRDFITSISSLRG